MASEKQIEGVIPLDEARQTQAQAYAMDRLRLRLITLVVSLAALLLLGPGGLAVRVRNDVTSTGFAWPVEVLIFFAVLGAAWSVVTLPFMYYGGFILPHRYGQSNQTPAEWLQDAAKAGALGAVLGTVAVEVLYGFLRATPHWWWLWTGFAFALIAVVLATLAPIVILPLFYRLEPLESLALARAIEVLARRAGTRVESVARINLSSKSPAANAAVIGLGPTRKIILGDTLLDSFPEDEVMVVVAHELGHHVNKDVLRGVAVGTILSLAGFFLTALVLQAAVDRFHFGAVWDLGALPLLVAGLALWSAASGVAERGLSRWMESRADAFSLRLTGLPIAYINSEIRLTNQNLSWYRPPAVLERLLYTHPAPWRRVDMGRRYLEGGSG